ncbi:hypothetical protein C3L33_13515, partial [Rhododendron williamsianum]
MCTSRPSETTARELCLNSSTSRECGKYQDSSFPSTVVYDSFLPWALDVAKEKDAPVLPGLPPLNLPDLPSFVLAPESHPAYLAMNLRQYSNVEKADWVFGNTFEKLEGQRKRMGPLASKTDRSNGAISIFGRPNCRRQGIRSKPVESTRQRNHPMARNKATGVRGIRLFRKHGFIGSRTDGGSSFGIEMQRFQFYLGGEGV